MDWNSSRKQCFTQHADLTVIDTREEMVSNQIHIPYEFFCVCKGIGNIQIPL